MTYLLLNHARNPLQDLLIRRALLLAMSTNESVPQNLIPSSLPSYPNAVQPDWAEWDIAKRVQEVQRLLEQANYTQQNPLPLTLSITKSTQDGLLAERLKEQLKAYPITLNVETRTPKAHLQALRAGAFDIARRTWVPGIDMPENFLSLFKCDMPLLNFGRVCNKEADALVEEALQVPDPQQRAALLKQVERLYIEEGAAIALGVPVANTLVSLKVTGWVDNPSGQHALRWLRLADNTQKQ
jgi:oligopeptide transport system substrate-binding protein